MSHPVAEVSASVTTSHPWEQFMKDRLKPLVFLLVGAALLPLQFAATLFHFRMGRVKAARARGDKGAISIELALAVIALVFIAGLVVFALVALKDKVVTKVNQDPKYTGGAGAPAGS
ncbi:MULTISPECIES: hypothetical protein [unclassified Streptomyces]|uniref:hypothetical protein n=1 Tax=unclassified Streptomyces TaxID=2593676 RepID=UPI000AB34569|nr:MULTISPECIES: hypothetical protein [unclassified Streptomyces]